MIFTGKIDKWDSDTNTPLLCIKKSYPSIFTEGKVYYQKRVKSICGNYVNYIVDDFSQRYYFTTAHFIVQTKLNEILYGYKGK